MKRAATVILPPIALPPRGTAPKYRQLYDWFQQAILSGRLRPGQRIPSTRILARELGVSRLPLLNAFEQLQAEGYFSSRVGSGTFVSSAIPDDQARPLPAASPSDARALRPRTISRVSRELESGMAPPWSGDSRAFRVSLPALDRFPMEIWSRLLIHHSRRIRPDVMAYGEPMGYGPLREAIAGYLNVARGVRCQASQIMITTGSQQGLQIASRALLDPGSSIWVEDPHYPGARQGLILAGARLIPVPVDQDGMRVDLGIARARNARAAYVTPSHQYPLGMTMSAARRLELLQWAHKRGSWIIEDDYDSEYRFGNRPVTSVQGLDSAGRVIYIGTFSKVLYPSIRLGYVVVPRDLIRVFSAVRDAADLFSATLLQAVLADFIREGHFARHLRRMRTLYMERRDFLLQAIQTHLGGVLQVANSDAGMHLVALLPRGISDQRIVREAATRGVECLPLSGCYSGRGPLQGLILGFGGAGREEIDSGVRNLALALRAATQR